MKILLCLSVFHSAVLGTASPLRPAYLPRHLSYFPESTEIASLSPRPPYSRLSPPTQSSEESLCFYFFSLQKWDNTAATTNNHKKKKKKCGDFWGTYTCFKHTIYLTPKTSQLHCCPGSGSCLNIHPLW